MLTWLFVFALFCLVAIPMGLFFRAVECPRWQCVTVPFLLAVVCTLVVLLPPVL